MKQIVNEVIMVYEVTNYIRTKVMNYTDTADLK
jgi:hypothetical protein